MIKSIQIMTFLGVVLVNNGLLFAEQFDHQSVSAKSTNTSDTSPKFSSTSLKPNKKANENCYVPMHKYTLYIANDFNGEHNAYTVYLPIESNEMNNRCGYFVTSFDNYLKINRVSQQELVIVAHSIGCFRGNNWTLSFDTEDTGLVYAKLNQGGRLKPAVVGSFTLVRS